MLGKTVIVNKMIKSPYAGKEGTIVEDLGDDFYNIYFPFFNKYYKFDSKTFSLKNDTIVYSWVYYDNLPLVRIEHDKYILHDTLKRWYANTYGFNEKFLSIGSEPACVKCPL